VEVYALILSKLLVDDKGATAIEYGLLMAMISMVLLAALNGLGFTLSGVFDTITAALRGA
jgi:pilus assembly protein Flp/PilA